MVLRRGRIGTSNPKPHKTHSFASVPLIPKFASEGPRVPANFGIGTLAMTAYDWLALVVVVICLLLSAFFAGSETALTASSRARMHRLEKQGNRRAALVNG